MVRARRAHRPADGPVQRADARPGPGARGGPRRRQGSEVSVALFDVDGFGALNADGAAEAGDEVLRPVAAVARRNGPARGHGRPKRWRRVRRRRARRAGATVARRVLEGIAGLAPVAGHRISVAAGVARFPADGADAATVVAAAQAALDRARADGHGVIETGEAPATQG